MGYIVPNIFAYIMLAVWPLLTVYFFTRKELRKAILWSVLGGYMILPSSVSIDLPALPPLDKFSIIIISVLFCCLIRKRKNLDVFGIKGLAFVCLGMLILSPFMTVYLNQDQVGFLPGLLMHDGLAISFNNFIFMAAFLLGRRFYAETDDQILIFKYFSLSALLY